MSQQNRQADTDRSLCKNGTVLSHIRPRGIAGTRSCRPHTPGERSSLTEGDATHVIGEALSDVPEEETRARVLAWAIGRFTESHDARKIIADATRTPVASGTSNPPVDIDDALSLESLETIFPDDRIPKGRIPKRLSNERVPKRKSPTTPPGLRAGPLLTILFKWRG